jgi:hypothetical protein
VLLVGLPVVMVTGLCSNVAYNPWLNGNVALQGRVRSPLDFYLFTWPAHPTWLCALNQGIHVSLGLALIPAILVKQWSVRRGCSAGRRFAAPAPRVPHQRNLGLPRTAAVEDHRLAVERDRS